MNWSAVENALTKAAFRVEGAPSSKEIETQIEKGEHVFPGAVLLVGRGGEIVFQQAFGHSSLVPEVRKISSNTVFDIASLTKALVTTTLIMKLVERGQLEIDRRLSRVFQTFGTQGKEAMTIRHLLTHSSGYPAIAPFYRQIMQAEKTNRAGITGSRGAVEMVYNEIFRTKLENVPGKVCKYSDLGFILLGYAAEESTAGQTLEKLAVKEVFSPLSLHNTGYIELSKLKRHGLEAIHERIAPTAFCPVRDRLIHGEVHDDNAWAMGGVAGHSGVFSTAADLHKFAAEMIRAYHDQSSFVNRDVVREFWKRDGRVSNSTWALGWDTPSDSNSSAGKHFSKTSVGHLGFTGCSMWIDPEREIDVILLTNRIHPSIENENIKAFRPLIHDLVMETLGVN